MTDNFATMSEFLAQHGQESPAAANLVGGLKKLGIPSILRDLFEFGYAHPFKGGEILDAYDALQFNTERADYGDLSMGIYFAMDTSSGLYFVDPVDFLGLGAGYVYWVDQAVFGVDYCVPAAENILQFLAFANGGSRDWPNEKPLGQLAEQRLFDTIKASDSVDCGPELTELQLLKQLKESDNFFLPFCLIRILLTANGFILLESGKRFFNLTQIIETTNLNQVEGLIWVGSAPNGLLYGMTTTEWNGYPSNRVIAVAAGQDINTVPVLGRTADVWTRWIKDEEEMVA